MNISENDSSEFSNEENNDVALYPLSIASKRPYKEDGDYSNKRPRREELEPIQPSTSGESSTSYNDESTSPRDTVNEDDFLSEDSSKEESSDEGLELDEPSTSGLKSKVYNIQSSAPKKTLHGLIYQLRLLMLFVQRVPDEQEFFLATEMHEAGYFDDIVLQYPEDGICRYRFLQAKHHTNDKFKIGIGHLFNKLPKSGKIPRKRSQPTQKAKKISQSSQNTTEKPYLLKKYFESYCRIKQDGKFRDANLEEFLICTNADFAEKAMTYFEPAKDEDDDPILSNLKKINQKNTNLVKYRLKKESISELKKAFEIKSKNKDSLLGFVEKFRFLTNYQDDQLNANIQDSLKKSLNIENVILADGYIQNCVIKWFEHYKFKKSTYLRIKHKEEFLKTLKNNIASLLVAGYSTFYLEELKSYGVRFENTLILREFFDHKKEKIMFIMTATPKLSVIKLSWLFDELKLKHDEFILTNAEKLRSNKKISTTFFAEQSCKWLVIEFHQNEIKLSRKMLNKILKMDQEKTVVMIGQKDHVLNYRECLSFDTPCIYDKNNEFKDMTIDSQEEILRRSIIFQGKKATVNKLININSATNIIDKLTLEKLISENIKIENNDSFQSNLLIEDYYIQRKLIRKKLRPDILQKEEILKSCLFLISGINAEQLKNLNINSEWIFKWEDGKIFENGIIISREIKSEHIFKELCKNNMKNIFWLEYINGMFLIMNMSNDTDILHKHFICLEENDLNEKQILKKKVILVADAPGCGKSMFMTRIAHHLKQKMSYTWVLRMDLSSYTYTQKGQKHVTKCLKDIKFRDSETDKAVEFMADLLFPQKYKKENKQFVRKLFTQSLYCLKENMKVPKVILLFDGFDEISPNFKEKTLTLLKALRNSKVAQMWITTRNQEELSLEMALHSSSFFLKPLNIKEKIDFFQKFWKYNLVNFDKIKPKPDSKGVLKYLTEITNNICNCCDKSISTSFRNLPIPSNSNLQLLLNSIDFSVIAEHLINYFEYSYKDKISEFTGNPLQLKMIAEIIVFRKFSSLDKLDIFSLYKEFIKYKWKIFRDDKYVAGQSVAGHNYFKIELEYLTTYHQNIAFKTLFHPSDNKQVKKKREKVELSRAGLLVIRDDRLEFVHRSFAEYFGSQYFVKNFKRKEIQKIIFSKVLKEKNYSLIRKFLNNNTIFLNKLGSKTEQMNEIIMVNSSNSLNQMLKEELYKLFAKFLENLPPDLAKKVILLNKNHNGRTVLHEICNFITDEKILKNLLKTLKNSISTETFNELLFEKDNEQRTALHATFDTFFNVVSSIVKQKLMFFKLNCESNLFYELLLEVDERGKTILHIACEYGRDITYLLEVTDETRQAISKLLLKTDGEGFTALYYCIFFSNKPSLITTLLNLGKSVGDANIVKNLFAIENASRNLLHQACYESNGDILVNFLNAIKDNKEIVEYLLLDTDKFGLTSLHYTVVNFSNLHMLEILLNFVKSNCSTEMLHTLLCKKTIHGTTVLHIAVNNFKVTDGHDSLIPLLTYLFNLVDDKKIFDELLLTRDKNQQTVLYYTCSQLKYPFLLKDLKDFVLKNCSANILDEL